MNLEKKSGLLAYLTALIPGVGYLYLGLKRKGIEALILWLIIGPLFNLLGLGFLAGIVKLPFWFYTFFDTINLAARIDKGEFIPDSDFLFIGRLIDTSSFSHMGSDGEYGSDSRHIKIKNDGLIYLAGWGLVVLGGLSLINKLFRYNPLYNLIKHNINVYFFPVLLVLAGIYLLVRNNQK
jgi:hypothetical protein